MCLDISVQTTRLVDLYIQLIYRDTYTSQFRETHGAITGTSRALLYILPRELTSIIFFQELNSIRVNSFRPI